MPSLLGCRRLVLVDYWPNYVCSIYRDGFKASVSTLWPLDATDGLSFHTLTLPQDPCGRLVVKNLARRMPKSVVREELESLSICVQGVTQLRFGRRDQDLVKDCPPTPLYCIIGAGWTELSKVRSLSELCGLRLSVESCVAPKGPLKCKRCQ